MPATSGLVLRERPRLGGWATCLVKPSKDSFVRDLDLLLEPTAEHSECLRDRVSTHASTLLTGANSWWDGGVGFFLMRLLFPNHLRHPTLERPRFTNFGDAGLVP